MKLAHSPPYNGVPYSLDRYTMLDFFSGFSTEDADIIEIYDHFYFSRKQWKVITKDFCGQIVQNIGKELE